MGRGSKQIKDLRRNQLDRRLDQIRSASPALQPPVEGWIAALREALGMTQRDFAKRLGVSQQAVGQLEKREVDGTVSLKALRDAARVLEGKLIYAVVPSRPVGEILEQRAYELARQMVTSVRHSMRLEDQETDVDETERVEAIARDLLSSPRLLWSDPNAE